MARGLKVFLTLVSIVFLAACSPQSQTHPLYTAPIPADAHILEEPCSGVALCCAAPVSTLSDETAIERRSACIAYVEPDKKRVEQCGSLLCRSTNSARDPRGSKPTGDSSKEIS